MVSRWDRASASGNELLLCLSQKDASPRQPILADTYTAHGKTTQSEKGSQLIPPGPMKAAQENEYSTMDLSRGYADVCPIRNIMFMQLLGPDLHSLAEVTSASARPNVCACGQGQNWDRGFRDSAPCGPGKYHASVGWHGTAEQGEAMGRLNVVMLRYLSRDHFRVLTAVRRRPGKPRGRAATAGQWERTRQEIAKLAAFIGMAALPRPGRVGAWRGGRASAGGGAGAVGKKGNTERGASHCSPRVTPV